MATEIRGLNETLARLSKAKKAVESPNLEAVGAYVVAAISDRCDEGVLPSGAKMKPYSEQYKAHREKKGRTTDVVNLQFTGKMLATMTWRVAGSRVTVLFSSQIENDKAAALHNNGRPFFDISAADEKRILRIIEQGVEDGA